MGDLPMTQRGFDKLRGRMDYLKNEALIKAQERLGAARELGDLSENSEYDAAREELWQVERQIGELEDQLARAEIVDASRVDQSVVSFGATVALINLATNKQETWTIVGHGEANVDEGLISIQSPLAAGLIGATMGETREIELPVGKRRFQIVSFKYQF